MRYLLGLLCLLVAFDAHAVFDTCTFTAATSCSSATSCTPAPTCVGGEGDLSGGDDLWDIGGTGQNETTRLTFTGAVTGETFTFTAGGVTSASIVYTSVDRRNLSYVIRAAMEAMSNIDPDDFAIECGSTTQCEIYWKGDFGCQDIAQPTCDSAQLTCTPSTQSAGQVAATPVTLTLTGNITQVSNASAGIRVRCDSAIVSESNTGRVHTLGGAGAFGTYSFTVRDEGSTVTLKGGIRQVGVAAPTAHAPPHTAADYWRVTGILNCPGGIPDCDLRRLYFDEQGHTAADDIANPFYYEALGNVVAGDVVYFPPGTSSMDEGFWYAVVAVARADPCTATNCYIDIDVRQSVTNSVGLTEAQKGIFQVGLAEDVAIGEGGFNWRTGTVQDAIDIDDAGVVATDDFIGWCVYIGDVPHRVRDTTEAATDSFTLLSEDGAQLAAANTEDVFFSRSCHRAGDEIVVAAPIRILSASTGLTAADQNDMDILFLGAVALDWVTIEWSGNTVRFSGASGSVDHVWSRDRGPVTEAAIDINATHGMSFGSLQATGNSDTNGGTIGMCAAPPGDCNSHGIDFHGTSSVSVDWFTARHLGDDCIVGYADYGGSFGSRLRNVRCETRLGTVSGMEVISTGGLANAPADVTIDSLMAYGSTDRGISGNDGTVFEGAVADRIYVLSGAILYANKLSTGVSGSFRNIYATRLDDADAAANDDAGVFFIAPATSMLTLDGFAFEDWTSSSEIQLMTQCMTIANGVVLPGTWTELAGEATGTDAVFRFNSTGCTPSTGASARNVAVVDLAIVAGGAQSIVGAIFDSAAVPGSLRNVLFYWTTRPASQQPDFGVYDAGFDFTGAFRVGGVAVIGFNGAASQWAWNFDALDNPQVTAGETPPYFADNVRDYPTTTDEAMPPGTIVGPRPRFANHRWIAPEGSEMKRIGAGPKGALGVCSRQPWHKWLDKAPTETCYGILVEVSPAQPE